MEVTIIAAIAILGFITVSIMMIIFDFKEFKLSKKIDLLKELVDKDFKFNINDI